MRKTDAEVVPIMRSAGLEPLEPYESSRTPWRCRCLTCERVVTPTYGGIRSGQGGCKFCAVTGLDYSAPGIVYLSTHPGWQAAKVGVTTTASKTDRIAAHTARGWNLLGTWSVPTGADAEDIENTILDWWRDELDAPDAVPAADMPQGGWTETASLVLVDLDETIARIDAAVDIVSSA